MSPDVLNSPELLNALGMIKIIAQSIAFLGIILWALSKMVSPVFPEIGERFNDAIVRIVMGAIAFNVIQTIGEAFQQW